jgi:hypothetical protein
MLEWLDDHRALVYGFAGSFVLGLLVLLGLMIFLVRMRPDALTKERPRGDSRALKIGRNILGWLLIAAGVAMLALPGPGLVVMLLGMTLADFPGKRRLQRWIISRRQVLGPINRLRKRFGREAVKVDGGE